MPKQRTAGAGTNQGAHSSATTPKSQMRDQSQSGSVVDEAKDKAQALADQAQHTVQSLADKAQDKVSQQLHSSARTGKNRAASALDSVAQSLVFSSQQLREQDQQGMSRYAEQAANKVEQLADYMQNTNVNEVVDRVEGFARREPAIFLGGAFALGLLGARFLKSSKRNQDQQRSSGSANRATRTGTGQQAGRPWYATTDREIPRPTESERY